MNDKRLLAWCLVLAPLIPAFALAADDSALSGSALVQIIAIVAPIIGTLGVAWFNLRAGQIAQSVKIAAVETKTTGIQAAASELDKKVDGVKADVAQVHEATNGLSHRLSEASGQAGFGKGQEQERRDERLRVAEAAAGHTVALPEPSVAVMGPIPTAPDARLEMLRRIEAMLDEFRQLPTSEPPPRDTLRNAVAQIQAQTDKLTFTTPNVVDEGDPPKKA